MNRCTPAPLLLVLLGLLLLLAPHLQSSPPASLRPLQVVLDNNYPPYCFLDAQGKLQGILVDRWILWGKKTGTPVEIIGLDWLVALDRMHNGEFDVIDTVFKTQERSTWLDFSEPHTRIEVPIFFHKDIGGITDARSAMGFRVGAKAGDAAVEILRKNGIDSLNILNNYESIILAARQGQFQLFVVDKPAALYFLHKHGMGKDYRFTEPVNVGEFHRAYHKGDLSTRASVESGFARISAEELARIDAHWMGSAAGGNGRNYHALLSITVAILALALLLLIWVQLLRWQVAKRTSALAESEARFRESIEFMPMPVGIADDQGNVLSFNREFTARYGYTVKDTPTMQEWIPKAYPDPVYRSTAQAQWTKDVAEAIASNANTPRRTYEIRAKDNSVHQVEITMRPFGKLFLTTFDDVTERNRAADELRRSETQYRRLHESMQDAYVRTDMDGRLIESNRAYRELLGYDETELMRRSYMDLTPAKWHATEREIIEKQVLVQGYSGVYEKEYVRKDGAIIPVELRTFLISDEQARPSQLWAIVRDLTERKRLEYQLLQAQKMEAIGQLAGGVAHDFNNILAAIMLNISLLETEPGLEENVRQGLGEVHEELNRATELTRQLLSFSRRQTMQMSTIRLGDVLCKYVRMLQRVLGEHIRLEHTHLEELPSLVANQGMIEQMIMNLCLNARDAMPQGGVLTLSGSRVELGSELLRAHPGCAPGAYVKLSIKDTGTGMSASVREHIFEPFFTTKELGHGTGLGLSIVFGIVKQHGGWIEVESDLGQGSTFTIYLPITDTGKRPVETPVSHGQTRGGREKILLVEDEGSVRRILCTGLQRLGYRVHAAASAAEARSLWQKEEGVFDLLLTDIIMPGGCNGIELAGQLKSEKPGLHVIVSSGYHKELQAESIPDTHRYTRLPKPYTIDQLSSTIRQVLDQPTSA